jgi:hypothetical protein
VATSYKRSAGLKGPTDTSKTPDPFRDAPIYGAFPCRFLNPPDGEEKKEKTMKRNNRQPYRLEKDPKYERA